MNKPGTYVFPSRACPAWPLLGEQRNGEAGIGMQSFGLDRPAWSDWIDGSRMGKEGQRAVWKGRSGLDRWDSVAVWKGLLLKGRIGLDR